MASEGGLIALTFLLLAALLLLLYCLLKQLGATKQSIRRICAFLFGASFLPRHMASGGAGPGQDEEESDFMDSGSRRTGGLFWKKLEEERSILECRRVPSTGLTSGGESAKKSGFQSMNLYHGDQLTFSQEDMATTVAQTAKVSSPLTNGVSTKHAYSNTVDVPAASQPPLHTKPPSGTHYPNMDAIPSTSPDYGYSIQHQSKKQGPMNIDSSPAVTPPPSSPGSQRHRQMDGKRKGQKPLEKSADPSTLAASIAQRQMQAAESSRPATPDFRYTVLTEDDEGANTAPPVASGGGTFRSVSMDRQLTPEPSDEARRYSLTSTIGIVSPALSIDNPSPTGSISDVDQESMLILEESMSGCCSRRTSISSMDSNLERLEESGRPSLLRAQSSDSLDSTTSIMELSMNETEIGQLETRLYYDSSNQYLHVWILQAYDLKPPPLGSASINLTEYWVVVFLLPHQKPLYRTQLQAYSPVLQFHEQFRQRVRDQDVRKLALLCQMYCRTRPSHETQSVSAALAAATASPSSVQRRGGAAGSDLIGQAKVRLKDVELSVANTLWLSLLPRIDNYNADQRLGELLFSLSYLPTAERLTVVVAKARSIRNPDGVMPEKIYVRVYLVYGAKISKKKTSVKTAVEGSAVFNESMIFSLSQNLVQKVYLRLSVIEALSTKASGEQRTIGHVTVGSRRASKEFGHWQKMTEQPRKPVSMWHHLSPKIQKQM